MTNPTKRIALYARVSTSNGQQDPEMQLRELREYAKHRDLTIVGEYVDRMTGSKDSRPSLNRLMADAGQRKFDAVLVWKLDRFGRSLKHLGECPGRACRFGRGLHQPARQLGSEHALRSADVPDHPRRSGGFGRKLFLNLCQKLIK